jgi:hypothetical protein
VAPESLFLATLEDLDARLELGRGEYDALCMAWLLRRLFHNGARSLVSLVDPDSTIDLVFILRDDLPGANVAGGCRYAQREMAGPRLRSRGRVSSIEPPLWSGRAMTQSSGERSASTD